MTIFDASQPLDISGRRILVDTNVWLLLEGPCFGFMQHKQNLYSGAYKRLRATNEILVSQYVLSEFCNRYVKIEFEYRVSAEGERAYPSLKRFRDSEEGRYVYETARDTCLNILDDCEYVEVSCGRDAARQAVESFGTGTLDFTDAVLRNHAERAGLTILTDDRDFEGCGVDLITANRKMLPVNRRS